jgi:lactoylglutathione lyase
MRNGPTVLGLFQGMFEGNLLTFNPGWNQNAEPEADYSDIRVIQEEFLRKGITLTRQAAENSAGPASFTLTDPDGNAILFDQHV